MNARNLLSVALLLFVAAAVVTIVVKQSGDKIEVSTSAATSADAELPAEGLVAYYFHGETRCPTCRHIQAYAHEAIETGFAEQLANGEISWQVVNYESPANAHFVTDYEIVAPTVVLVRTSHGQPIDWRNLSRVWNLVGEKEAFVEYVQREAVELLDTTAG
jgi:hypothetical protein